MQIDLELIRSIDRRLDEQKSMLIHLERQGRRDRKSRERGEIERPAGLVTRWRRR